MVELSCKIGNICALPGTLLPPAQNVLGYGSGGRARLGVRRYLGHSGEMGLKAGFRVQPTEDSLAWMLVSILSQPGLPVPLGLAFGDAYKLIYFESCRFL